MSVISLSQIAAKYFPDYVSDWASRLASRLYTQFRGKTTWADWVTLLARQAQDLEDSALTLFTINSIDDSEGVQLDRLGRIIGQQRVGGADDVTYRLYLKARVLANKSAGTSENLYSIFSALFGATTIMVYVAGGIKQFVIRIVTPITSQQAAIGVEFLGDAKEAGARGILEWQESATANMLILDSTDPNQCLDAGALSGMKQA